MGLLFIIINPFWTQKWSIDWNLIISKQEAMEKYNFISSCDKIYFIDRKESNDSTIKIYPTKLFKLKYY